MNFFKYLFYVLKIKCFLFQEFYFTRFFCLFMFKIKMPNKTTSTTISNGLDFMFFIDLSLCSVLSAVLSHF